MVFCVVDVYQVERWNNLYQEDRRNDLDERGQYGAESSASGPSARTSLTEERANSFLVSLLRSGLSARGRG